MSIALKPVRPTGRPTRPRKALASRDTPGSTPRKNLLHGPQGSGHACFFDAQAVAESPAQQVRMARSLPALTIFRLTRRQDVQAPGLHPSTDGSEADSWKRIVHQLVARNAQLPLARPHSLAAGFLYGRFRDKHAGRAGLKVGLAVLAVMGAPVLDPGWPPSCLAATCWAGCSPCRCSSKYRCCCSWAQASPPGSFFNRPWSGEPVKPGACPPAAVECSHLQPLKLGMRSGNIEMRPAHRIHTQANCRINLKEVARRYGPAVAALYEERHFIDRSFHEPKSAYFWCAACGARLGVVHLDEACDATPWFPLPAEKHGEEPATSAACSW